MDNVGMIAIIVVLAYLGIGSVVSYMLMKVTEIKDELLLVDDKDYLYIGFVFLALALIWPLLLIMILVFWLCKLIGKRLSEKL